MRSTPPSRRFGRVPGGFLLPGALILLAAISSGEGKILSKTEILEGADARIERYRKGDAVLRLIGPDGKPPPPGASAQIEQIRHRFLFGCNIFQLGTWGDPEKDAGYEKRFADLFNFATLPFYWWGYEKVQGKPDYPRTERIIPWCREHGVTMKGHPLAWNWVDPSWLPDDSNEVLRLQFARIRDCILRFRSDIHYWDVVNEATEYDRPGPRDQAPKLTAAIKEMGVENFLRKAFRTARAADPNAVLLINDYQTSPAYAEKVISKLVDEDGKPLYDVIGIQSHQHGGAWTPEQTWEVCERFAVFGVPLHFTETTFLSGKEGWELKKKEGSWPSTPEGEARQAEQAARFYTILFSHPAVEAITWWDFCDGRTWQGAPSGLIRADMSPKPAYDALHDLIRKKWWTRLSAKIGDDGTASFRGFYGRYEVRVETDGGVWSGRFELNPDSQGPIPVALRPAE